YFTNIFAKITQNQAHIRANNAPLIRRFLLSWYYSSVRFIRFKTLARLCFFYILLVRRRASERLKRRSHTKVSTATQVGYAIASASCTLLD
ncbi:MAG: hypothetical protein KAF91_01165, partial [Nostoc sp. TH1S01]|nr:hypothetical protein [Nostoc sp. TH1S01]